MNSFFFLLYYLLLLLIIKHEKRFDEDTSLQSFQLRNLDRITTLFNPINHLKKFLYE